MKKKNEDTAICIHI